MVANHYSDFDSVLIFMLLFKNKKRFVVTEDVKLKFYTRFFCWCFNCLYVGDNLKTNIKFYREALNYLKSGGNIVIFPEGVINPRKFGFLDFKEGYISLQERANASILPLFIYPKFRPFNKSQLYVGDIIIANKLKNKTSFEKNIFILEKISDYSSEILKYDFDY